MDLANAAPLGIAALGLVVGMRHATDPDHVVAVTTIVTREARLGAAARIGMFWGIGHTLTIVALGAAIIVFKIAIPARLGLALEFAVALVLILLGISAANGTFRACPRCVLRQSESPAGAGVVHSHPHRHGAMVHTHPHAHLDHAHLQTAPDGEVHEDHRTMVWTAAAALRHPLARAFGVGLVHGLAGSAAITLLVLAAIPDPLWGVLYLLIFGLGTVLGMVLITTAIAMPFAAAPARLTRLHGGLATGSGLLSLGFGLFLAYQIGIVDGLFRATVSWTPH